MSNATYIRDGQVVSFSEPDKDSNARSFNAIFRNHVTNIVKHGGIPLTWAFSKEELADFFPYRTPEITTKLGVYQSTVVARKLPSYTEIIQKYSGSRSMLIITAKILKKRDGSMIRNDEVWSYPRYSADKEVNSIDKLCKVLPEIVGFDGCEEVYKGIDIEFYKEDTLDPMLIFCDETPAIARLVLKKPFFKANERTSLSVSSRMPKVEHEKLVQDLML